MGPLEDRRLFQRFSARFPVRFQESPEDFGREVVLKDASAQGLKISTSKPFFVNDFVNLEIKLPDGQEPLALNGQVVWMKKQDPSIVELGIRFHKIQLMRLQRLFKFSEEATAI